MNWRRNVLLGASFLWLLWFALATYANLEETGTFVARPTEVHDLPDLLVWGALAAVTYVAPFILALCWWVTLKRTKNA